MEYQNRILEQIELHSVEGIIDCFRHGVDPNSMHNNQPLFNELTSEYYRSSNFKECVKAFVDHGLVFDDQLLLAVLLDNADMLKAAIAKAPESVHRRYTLRCAYTPFYEVTLLHICAEYNHIQCAEVLVESGIDVNAKGGVDVHGFGGQTPIFHTVNQNQNHSVDMMQFLIDRGANLEVTVKGLVWGKGYEWETFVPSVNPISYAMMGLLPQMHRRETDITENVARLIRAAYGLDYRPPNVPNKYLER